MHRLNRFSPAGVSLVALFSLSGCGGGPTLTPPSPDNAVLLRLAPPTGQVTRYRTKMETATEMAGMPMATGPITMDQTLYQTNTVLEADGDVRRISSVIDDVQMAARGVPGMMGQEETLEEMLEGFATEVTMTTRGRVLSVEMPDSSPATEMLRGFGMEDLMIGASPAGTPLEFPEEPLRPGATWTVPVERSIAMGGLFQAQQAMEITYRFESLEIRNGARYAILSFGGPIETTMVPDSSAPMAMDMRLQGEMSGEMELDLDAGFVGTTIFTTSASGLMSMMGQAIDVTQTMKIEQTPIHSIPNTPRIVFQSNRTGTWDIFSMREDGSDLVNLTRSRSQERFASCSPDGSKIAFYSDRNGNREIYTMNADGSDQARLTNDPGRDEIPAWSPDGSRIAFQTTRDGNWEIYLMNADGSDPVNLTNHDSNDFRARWSPDGSTLVFQTERDGSAEVYVVNANGSDPVQLTNSPGYDGDPSWSHDGSRITFISRRDGNPEVYVMDSDGSNQRRLTDHSNVDGSPSWSPDDSFIVFHSERDRNGEIYAMTSNGSRLLNLTNHPADDFSPSWCPVIGPAEKGKEEPLHLPLILDG